MLEWFLDDASYNQLARPVCDDVNYTGVITWQGVVYDNSTFRRRGHTSCTDPKPKIEMQLPAGYAIDFNGTVPAASFAEPMSGVVDEFALQDEGYPIPGLGWDNIGDLTDPTVGYLPVRSQRNAAFFGAGAILEEYDGSWRGRKGRTTARSTRSRPAASARTRRRRRSSPPGTSPRRTRTTPTTPTPGSSRRC